MPLSQGAQYARQRCRLTRNYPKKLFASVPSRAGAGGNAVTEINPVTATLGTSVFVGSEPNKMAISEDEDQPASA